MKIRNARYFGGSNFRLLQRVLAGEVIPPDVAANITSGLVAFWALDEPTGSIRYNSVSDSLHLLDVNTVGGEVFGKVFRSAHIDKSNYEILQVADDGGLNSTGAFSVGCWIYPINLPSDSTNIGVITKYNSASDDRGYFIGLGNDGEWQPRMGVQPTGSVVYGPYVAETTDAFTTGVWQFMVGVFDSEADPSVTIYYSGLNSASSAENPPRANPTTADFIIGTWADLVSNTGAFYDGYIDDAFFYNRALTTGEINWLYNEGSSKTFIDINNKGKDPYLLTLSSGIKNFWTFESTNDFPDDIWDYFGATQLVSSSNTQTSGIRSAQVTGLNFSGLKFSAVDSAKLYNNAYTPDYPIHSGDFSVSIWVKPDQFSFYNPIVSQWDVDVNTSKSWRINCVESGYTQFAIQTTGDDGSNFVWQATGEILDSGQWNHCCAVKNNNLLYLYKNGSLIGSSTDVITGNYSNDYFALQFGWMNSTIDAFFNGSIDDAGIWTRALNTGEINALYNNGSGIDIVEMATGEAYLLDDTYVRGGADATTNYGGVAFVRNKGVTDPDFHRRSWFCYSGVPNECNGLSLRCVYSNTDPFASSTVYALDLDYYTGSFDEYSLTWNTTPTISRAITENVYTYERFHVGQFQDFPFYNKTGFNSVSTFVLDAETSQIGAGTAVVDFISKEGEYRYRPRLFLF